MSQERKREEEDDKDIRNNNRMPQQKENVPKGRKRRVSREKKEKRKRKISETECREEFAIVDVYRTIDVSSVTNSMSKLNFATDLLNPTRRRKLKRLTFHFMSGMLTTTLAADYPTSKCLGIRRRPPVNTDVTGLSSDLPQAIRRLFAAGTHQEDRGDHSLKSCLTSKKRTCCVLGNFEDCSKLSKTAGEGISRCFSLGVKPCCNNLDHYSAFASEYKKDTGCRQFGRTSIKTAHSISNKDDAAKKEILLAMMVRENAIWVLRVRGEDEDGGEVLAVREGDRGDELAVAARFRLRLLNVDRGGSNMQFGFWAFLISDADTIAIERAWLRWRQGAIKVKVNGDFAIWNEDGAVFVHGGLIVREDEPVVVLMAARWPCGDTLHEP
ncbi:hypothetical protein V8G54_013034 [Vigna mungo]|uniref:Uncharacterized protein n=1 Tax=Vigna mungo TaxID=3915 RepID=A0AAQ3S3X7_VIGMU